MNYNVIYSLKFLFVLLALGGCIAPKSKKYSPVNFQANYDYNAPIQALLEVVADKDSTLVYAAVDISRFRKSGTAETFKSDIKIAYTLQQDYKPGPTVQGDSLRPSEITKMEGTFRFMFKIKPSEDNSLLILTFYDKKTDQYLKKDLLLSFSAKSLANPILKYKNGSLNHTNFLLMSDSTMFRNTSSSSDLFAYFYTFEFPPALPPMSTPGKGTGKSMKIDSSFIIQTDNIINFTKTGLYFIQSDTNTKNGISIRVQDNGYPKYNSAESLIKPLIYISPSEELKAMNNAKDPKKALDNFWIKLGGNANQAKRLIKEYYDRVEATNRKFTSYKEGWKTDMGIVFIVFGRPDVVYKTLDSEEWIYKKTETNSEIRFTFVRVPNIFSSAHFELVRYPEYEKYWYTKVDTWRKGNPEM